MLVRGRVGWILGGTIWGNITEESRQEMTFKLNVEGFPWTVKGEGGCVRLCEIGTGKSFPE